MSAVPCPNHPGRPSEDRACPGCGEFVCDLCRIPLDRRRWCPRCYERRIRRAAPDHRARAWASLGMLSFAPVLDVGWDLLWRRLHGNLGLDLLGLFLMPVPVVFWAIAASVGWSARHVRGLAGGAAWFSAVVGGLAVVLRTLTFVASWGL